MKDGFEGFWNEYPKKVGKLAAMKAYKKAITLATLHDILDGVERYKQHLPEDPQYICHASTWLNQGRWMDEYDSVPVKQKAPKRILAWRPSDEGVA